ncbi:MAG TPA: hypothetical protein VF184_00550 [Phycisphaeraceae bacterium]
MSLDHHRPRGMAAWLHMWDRYWFPRTTAVRLDLLRLIVVPLQMLFFTPSLEEQINRITGNEGFIQPQAIIRWLTMIVPEAVFRTPQMATAIWWGTGIAGVLALVGVLTRPAMLLFALGNWVMIAHQYSYGDKHHPQAIYCLFLLLMAMAPLGRAISLESFLRRRWARSAADAVVPNVASAGWGPQAMFTTAFWPMLLVQWMLSLAYLNAGLCKILRPVMMARDDAGLGLLQHLLDWLDGYTLQGYLLEDAIRWNRPVGLWLAQHHGVCVAMSIFAVVFELAFWLALVFPRLVPVMLLGGVAMHVGIFIAQAAPFWQFLVLYLAFLPLEKLPPFRQPAYQSGRLIT